MSEIDKKAEQIIAFSQKLRCFEGYISGIEVTSRDDGSLYCKFSIPLKKKKEDEPVWLNCYIYGSALCDDFTAKCTKGARVWVTGMLKKSEKEGNEYLNFLVKDYKLLEYPKTKTEGEG